MCTETNNVQALRGSASSFGIVTSMRFKTHKAPDYALIFQYNWHLNYTEAADSFGLFQQFVQTDIPSHLGMEIVLTQAPISGNISFGLTGSWYGRQGELEPTLQPFLQKMPPLNSVTFSGNGTWIDNLVIFAGGSLNTTLAPDITDTFYAKSLMTPEAEPLSHTSRLALMKHLSTVGVGSPTV